MANNPEMLYVAAATLCALIASGYDLWSRRIPNRLTGPAIVCGLLLHLALGGLPQLGLAALSGLIGGGVFLVFFVAGGMGAGDVKLMTAVGCLAGTMFLKEIMLTTVLVGACMGISLALYRSRLRETLANVGLLLRHHAEVGMAAHPDLNVKNQASLRLPYAVPIAAGCVVTLMVWIAKRAAL